MKTLYHFASRIHMQSIKIDGLTQGAIPMGLFENPRMEYGYRWLTLNPEKAQSWTIGSTLPYDRTEFRATVTIPTSFECNLFWWLGFCSPEKNSIHIDLNDGGDPENWYVYRGNVPRQWIRSIRLMA